MSGQRVVQAAGPRRAGGTATAAAHVLGARRREMIADRVLQLGEMRVDELAVDFGVTPQTIRSDLRWLDQRGLVRAVRGGALPPLSASTHVAPVEATEGLADLMQQLRQVQRQLEAIVDALPSATVTEAQRAWPSSTVPSA